jgi:hypothetical protein
MSEVLEGEMSALVEVRSAMGLGEEESRLANDSWNRGAGA